MNRKNPRHKEMKILCQTVSETRVGSQTFYWKICMLLFLNRYSDVTESSRNLKLEDFEEIITQGLLRDVFLIIISLD